MLSLASWTAAITASAKTVRGRLCFLFSRLGVDEFVAFEFGFIGCCRLEVFITMPMSLAMTYVDT